MKAGSKIWNSGVLLGLLFFFAGCPRIAEVRIFNNSGVDLQVFQSGEDLGILENGSEITFRFTGQKFTLNSPAYRWIYDREIPHAGEDGEFFDGTLRAQVEADGSIYALRREEIPPLPNFNHQPPGFPMKPKAQQAGDGNERHTRP